MDKGNISERWETLLIRAPSGQEAELRVCLDWTVLRMKEEISLKWPGQPKCADQRLVYSGKLLQNEIRLKDLLNLDTEASNNCRIVHLVCRVSPTKQPSLSVNNPSSSSSDLWTHQPIYDTTNSENYNHLYIVEYLIHLENLTPGTLARLQDSFLMNSPNQSGGEINAAARVGNGGGNNDNLDLSAWMYDILRVGLLAIIVYVYSPSFLRLAIVSVFVFFLYVNRMYTYRRMRQEATRGNVVADQDREETQENVDTVQEQPGILTTVTTFFTMLVSSILPQPNAVV